MPIIARYEMRIEGALNGPRTATTDGVPTDTVIKEFIKTIEPPPSIGLGGSGSKERWPAGFVLRGYKPFIWHFDVLELPAEEAPPKDRTLLTFHAEVAAHLPVELTEELYQDKLNQFRKLSDLSDPRLINIPGRSHGPVHAIATEHHEWFLDHCDQAWCKDLVGRLEGLNATYKGKLAEKFRMRRMHWYLGNGS